MDANFKSLSSMHFIGVALLFGSGLLTPTWVSAGNVSPTEISVNQQTKRISGNVKDDLGNPIIGANVTVVGTTNGIITDIDGNYQLTVSPGDDIQVSYIGYVPQQFKVTNQSVYDIVLKEDTEVLDEVVVVGYGTARKSDISGSVASVNKEQMMKRNPINLTQGLQGAAAGVMVTKNSGDPEGTATIRVRGVATVNGSANPLYVVDGVQVGTSADFVNPSDVESIEILKDASATAIYGARGANGVILITTKKGVKGHTQLNLTANFGVQNMVGKLKVADADLFAYSVRQGRANDASSITNKAFGEEYAGRLNNIDWQDVMTHTAFQQNYNLSVSGGNDKTQSNFSVGYLKNDGVIIESSFQRLTARANAVTRVKEYIEIGGSLAFIHSEKIGSGNIRDYAILTPTMDYVDQTTGAFISNSYLPNADGSFNTFMQVTGEGDIQKGQDNPYAVVKERDKTPSYNNQVIGSAYLNLDLYKGLQFRTIGSYNLSTYDGSGYSIANERINAGAEKNSFWMSQSQDNSLGLESYFTYNWKNDKNNLTLMAGNSFSNYWGHWVSASASDFLSDTYRKISLTSDQASRTGDGGYNLKTRYVSWYGRGMYVLMDRYIVTATVRRDGSSNFGKGNRWGTFPSAAVAWRLSEEDFMQKQDLLSNLKLRFGWGQTGNAGNPTNLSVTQLSSNRIAYNWGQLGGSSYGGNKVVGFAQLKEIDTNLKWETNTQTNVGVDLGFMENSLNITADYFIRDSKNLLLYRNMRPSTGHGAVYTNAGHIKNEGFEFNINYNKTFGDWTLGGSFIGSTLKNKVLEVGDPIYADDVDDGDNWGNHSVTMEDYAVGSFYGYVVEGIFKDQAEVDAYNAIAKSNGYEAYQVNATAPGDFKYKDLNGDGHIDGDDQQVLGNGFPKFNYGITVNVGYKNWDAMLYMYGMSGFKIYSYASMKMTQLYKTTGGIQNTLVEYINNSWTPENQNAKYPRMTIVDRNTNAKASSAYIKNGNFFKLANIQIGYTFPKQWIRPLLMDYARVFVSVENLACISKYNKYGDPEVGNSNVLFTGFDSGRYPYPRTFTLGLNVQF